MEPVRLALYYYDTCGYCRRVLRVIDELGLDVELRHIYRDAAARLELMGERGRTRVPVLRIESADGTVQWMPESRDIVDYLRRLPARRASA